MRLCVVGSERSGTSAISTILSVGCDLSLLDDPREAWYAIPLVFMTSREFPAELLRKIREHDVVKVPALAAVLPQLRRALKESFPVLYCVRDPRDVVASIQERLRHGDSLMAHAEWLGVQTANRVEALAWKWRRYLETALMYRDTGEDVVFLRYEDFVQDKTGTLRETAERLGLAFDEESVRPLLDRQHRKRWSPTIAGPQRWRKDLEAHEVREIERICGPLMEICGYRSAKGPLDASPAPAGGTGVSLENRSVSVGGEILAAEPEGPPVCVVVPGKAGELESFIRAHLERLPARVRLLHNGPFPRQTGDGRLLVRLGSLRRRSIALFRQRVLRFPPSRIREEALRDFLVDEGIRVVLAEYGPTAVSVMNACRRAGVPLAAHFHGVDAYGTSMLESWGKRYAELFGKAAAVIAVSRDMEKRLLEMGAPREKLHWNPCGVDTARFPAGDPGAAPPRFLFVGRFVDKKGPHLTILAFWKLLQHVPDAALQMIGDGPLLGSCRQLVRGLGIESSVSFSGVLPHEEIPDAMRTSRAYVQHSVRGADGDSEGTPVSILEAAASALPVVATKHGGIVEIVEEGRTGFLVDEGDVEGMSRAMIRLAQDGELAPRLGRAGRERVAERYSMEKSIGRLWEILRGVMIPDGSSGSRSGR